ncbi:MAG TPA: hypothetical protein DDX84_07865 [Nitrospiraceae bacterium]|nr:hypothetical protein [Nitrospiraceae bacterium]
MTKYIFDPTICYHQWGVIKKYLKVTFHKESNKITIVTAVDKNRVYHRDTSHISYDYENRLVSVSPGGIAFKYDPLGRRLEKNVSGTITRYFFDGARVIEERDGSDVTVATYVFGSWIDEILTMDRGGNIYYYHQNSLGSVAAVTNSAGVVVERYEYDAYGNVSVFDGSYTSLIGSAIGNPYMFTGREYDPETGFYYYRARYYDPVWGRFLQRDPLGYVDGMNLYEYVRGNAANSVDSLGLQRAGNPVMGPPDEVSGGGGGRGYGWGMATSPYTTTSTCIICAKIQSLIDTSWANFKANVGLTLEDEEKKLVSAYRDLFKKTFDEWKKDTWGCLALCLTGAGDVIEYGMEHNALLSGVPIAIEWAKDNIVITLGEQSVWVKKKYIDKDKRYGTGKHSKLVKQGGKAASMAFQTLKAVGCIAECCNIGVSAATEFKESHTSQGIFAGVVITSNVLQGPTQTTPPSTTGPPIDYWQKYFGGKPSWAK